MKWSYADPVRGIGYCVSFSEEEKEKIFQELDELKITKAEKMQLVAGINYPLFATTNVSSQKLVDILKSRGKNLKNRA